MKKEEEERLVVIKGGTRYPVTDPTELTTKAVDGLRRELTELFIKELAIRDERMAGIDSATVLRLGGIQAIPSMIQEKVDRLNEVINAWLIAMDGKLNMFDGLRLELKADSKTSIDAALLAQKEQATLQDQANQKAIDKQNDQNEKASDKLTELFRAEMAALRTEIGAVSREMSGLDTRLTKAEATKTGGQEAIAEKRGNNSAIIAAISFGILILTLLIALGIITAVDNGKAIEFNGEEGYETQVFSLRHSYY